MVGQRMRRNDRNKRGSPFDRGLDAVLRTPGLANAPSVVLGCSGGADSTFAALVLAAWRHATKGDVALVCVDHGIRPEASEECAFVERLAKGLGLEFFCVRVDAPGRALTLGQNLEEAARDLRYGALEKIAMPRGAVIVTAHHAEDRLETFFLHAIRGSGLYGLCGMRAQNGGICRPFLGFTHREMTDALRSVGQSWCEDPSNADLVFRRNALRARLRDAFSEEERRAMAKSLATFERVEQTLVDFVVSFLRDHVRFFEGGLSVAVADIRRVFPRERGALYMEMARLLSGQTRDLYGVHVASIDAILDAKEEKRFSVGKLCWVVSAGRLYLLEGELPPVRMRRLRRPEGADKAHFFWDGPLSLLTVGTRLPGERMRLTSGRHAPLAKLWMERGVPAFLRDRMAVVRHGEEVLYAEGIGMSAASSRAFAPVIVEKMPGGAKEE